MRNTAAKKRAGQEDVNSDYLFGDAKREMPKIKIKLAWAKGSPVITHIPVGYRRMISTRKLLITTPEGKREERVGIFGVLSAEKLPCAKPTPICGNSSSTSQPSLGQPHCDRQ